MSSRGRGTHELARRYIAASEAVASLDSVRRRDLKDMNKRHLLIIARRVPLMYESLKQSFARHGDIDVILDRRRRERRWQVIPIDVDRRGSERRTMDIAALLRQLGWVVVEQKADC
jgi:hypothetical protein